jgi:hypothetical protein
MPWFQRDHTHRTLQPVEREFVTALGALLAAVDAPQIAAGETALTAEASTCLIALIPHRALGGISIVVWLFEDRAEVTWADVEGLDRSHDSIDLGIRVGLFKLDRTQPNFDPILECIRKQIDEPLTLRSYGDARAEVFVHDHRGKLRRIGQMGRPIRWSKLFRDARPTHETVIRLSDREPPPMSSPSGVEQWFSTE